MSEVLYFRAKFGADWTVFDRLTAGVRERYRNPITRRAYNEALAEYRKLYP